MTRPSVVMSMVVRIAGSLATASNTYSACPKHTCVLGGATPGADKFASGQRVCHEPRRRTIPDIHERGWDEEGRRGPVRGRASAIAGEMAPVCSYWAAAKARSSRSHRERPGVSSHHSFQSKEPSLRARGGA